MASPGDPMVSIERGYFETLVRRAQFNIDDADARPSSTISIAKSEHDRLKAIAAQYANLRRNLERGGVDEATIDLLVQDDAAIQGAHATSATYADVNDHGGVKLEPQHRSPLYQQPKTQPATTPYPLNGTRAPSRGPQSWAEADAGANHGSDDNPVLTSGPPEQQPNQSGRRPQLERECQRTVQLSNLAEGVTHGDITNAVRGGQLLDVFLRTQDRSASVSFLHSADAKAFYNHIRKHDLYVKNKRVDVRWSNRQFTLPRHVANKVGDGATRNLIVRRCDPRHTEGSIRDDLEHIHNLVVIKIEFIGGSCFIRTNSVHNAMFARTCMMSRAKYKGSKIEWDVDECAQSLSRGPVPNSRKEAPPAKKATGAVSNRFQLLDMDGDEDEDEITSTFRAKKAVGIAA